LNGIIRNGKILIAVKAAIRREAGEGASLFEYKIGRMNAVLSCVHDQI